ncbi:hypothetical protein CBR_g34611 [Chara braunii]|uniref:Uncharacterized protein n=1 Tax=Chara braunii TaxID=69332 RepID=A0A388LJ37_CHABU|nr:hypothetical protein CBR_g34611 [Chara braunii]|eukprot:GBG82328.1 hypothetical protein CBR_g34611 [Chara braunii]
MSHCAIALDETKNGFFACAKKSVTRGVCTDTADDSVCRETYHKHDGIGGDGPHDEVDLESAVHLLDWQLLVCFQPSEGCVLFGFPPPLSSFSGAQCSPLHPCQSYVFSKMGILEP